MASLIPNSPSPARGCQSLPGVPRGGRDARSALLAAVLAAVLPGCNDTRDLAPLGPTTPWQTDVVQRESVPTQRQKPAPVPAAPGARSFALPRVAGLPPVPKPPSPEEPGIDPAHVYDLPELIDLAQRRSQTTRIAWEQARQAAIRVGISQSTLLPELTVDALGGYSHTASPFPTALSPRGYITADAQAVFPELVIKYLLIDFGGRRAGVETARQLSFAGNVAFTAAHQKLILDVAQAYFQLDALNAQLATARTALANARLLETAATAKRARGEGTVTDQAIATRGVAQAALGIPQAETAQSTARLDLLALLDLPPQTRIQVASSAGRSLERGTTRTLDTMMEDALRQRPDMLIDLARLRASEQQVARARSDMFPKLSIAANLQGNIGQLSTNGGPYEGIKQPQAGVYLRFDWTLYQGGALRNARLLAQSQREEADASLRKKTTQALREVALAYEVLTTSLAQYDATVVYRQTAQTAFDAASSAFAHGVGTITDAAQAQTALATADAALVQAHSQAMVNAAALAFTTGDLTSAERVGSGGGS